MSRFFAPAGVVLLMGVVATSAWAQPGPIDIPIGSGGQLMVGQPSALFVQPVFTTTDVDLRLQVFVDGVCKYNVCRRVLTSGPVILVCTRVPVGTFGLAAGNTVEFRFTCDKLGVAAGRRSVVKIIVPVVAEAGAPPPTTTRASERIPKLLHRERVGVENA